MARHNAPLILLALVTALGLAAPRAARADPAQTQNFAIWKQMDKCAAQANAKFPDHTPDGNAKREAARQECLRANHLPVSAAPSPGR